MDGDRLYLDVVDSTCRKFDKAIEVLLISLLAFAPLAFGVVDAWSEEVVLALAAAISICFLLKLVVGANARILWSWTYMPLMIFILLATLQLIPLPRNIVQTFSPNTLAIKNELLGDLPDCDTLLGSMTLSFYPNATKHDIRLVFAVVTVFFVVLNVYRRPDQIKRLLAAVTIIGGSIALLALAQDLFGNGGIYWTVATGKDAGPYSATFINHSHYGQFMNLSIGAALGLLLAKLSEACAGRTMTPTALTKCINSHSPQLIWFLILAIVLGAATVFVSLTRGGMLSMFAAAAVTAVVLGLRKSSRESGWIVLLAGFAAFMCVVYVGFDAVYDRLASLRQLHQAEGGRWQLLKDVAVVCGRFPLLGAGLGTHEVVFPMFDRSAMPMLATYAENEYAQITEETGLLGLGTLIVFGIMVWTVYIHNVRKQTPICSAAYGLGFGLMAILIHSLSDFGQHLPANSLLSATFCALLLSLSRTRHKDGQSSRVARKSRLLPVLGVAGLMFACPVWVWVLVGANNARLAEAYWNFAHALSESLMDEGRRGTDEEYLDLISSAAAAAEYQPDNVKYQHWLNVYRWQSISGLSDPNTGEIILSEDAVDTVHAIVSELDDARLLCPTYGPIYCVLGQLERSVLEDPNGADRIRKGFQLAPSDPTVCFVAGLLDLEDEQIDASLVKLDRAVAMDGRFFRAVADIYVNFLERPDLAVTLSADSTSRLSHVADLLAESDQHQYLAEQARSRVLEVLESKCEAPDAPAQAFASLANIYRKEGMNEAAVRYYRRALALDYGQISWRLALTKLLAETDNIPEAIREARTCVRLGPQVKAAEKLLADLCVLPGAVTDERPTP